MHLLPHFATSRNILHTFSRASSLGGGAPIGRSVCDQLDEPQEEVSNLRREDFVKELPRVWGARRDVWGCVRESRHFGDDPVCPDPIQTAPARHLSPPRAVFFQAVVGVPSWVCHGVGYDHDLYAYCSHTRFTYAVLV